MSGPRLVLFDVDGTLLSSGRKGLDAFSEALRRTFGTEGAMASFRFEGKLDPVIVLEPGGHDWAYWRSVFVPFAAGVAGRLDRAEEAG